jgi:hypothetical protein
MIAVWYRDSLLPTVGIRRPSTSARSIGGSPRSRSEAVAGTSLENIEALVEDGGDISITAKC